MNQTIAAALVSLIVMMLAGMSATVWTVRDTLHEHALRISDVNARIDRLEDRIARLERPAPVWRPMATDQRGPR